MAGRGYRQCDNATKVHHSYTAAADNRAFVPFEFGDELYELVRVKKVHYCSDGVCGRFFARGGVLGAELRNNDEGLRGLNPVVVPLTARVGGGSTLGCGGW